ncbi:DUF6541 family protein [Pseudarthrobacter sp. ATCC 49987]|uniref:DUF6541 family protein n=1 Tax=Pseudarthrobacter sp. ATCC 49987 TaxID=2698204 RepID=UPI00137200EE|nr:DUF6541 family protein [Pseudarthrobacter sp. ATCC 49987]
MSWFDYVPAFLTGACILLLPGLGAGYAFGARGLMLWAGAGPLSVSLIGASAVLAAAAGIPWSILAVTGLSVLACLVGLALRRWIWPPRGTPALTSSTGRAWLVPASLIVSGSIVGFRIISIFESPDNISQTFDNVFHLNAIRFILDTGSASSLTIGNLVDSTGHPGIYPAAWHAFVSLTVQLTALPIPGVVNVCNVLIGALIWPAGCVYLTRRILGANPVATWVAAIAAAGFSQFPYLLLDFGVLYPLMLATAVLPFALSLVVSVLDTGNAERHGIGSSALVLAMTVPGIALAHPSALLALLAFGTPWVLKRLITWNAALVPKTAKPLSRVLPFAVMLCFVLGAYIFWKALRPEAEAAFWPPIQSLSQAFGEAVTASGMGRPMPVVLAVLTVTGVCVAASARRLWPLLMSFTAAVALYVVVSGMWFGRFRSFLTGGWYNDSNRIAALLPVVTVPVVALGAVWIAGLAVSRYKAYGTAILRALPSSWRRFAYAGSVALVWVSFAGITQFQTVEPEVSNGANSYRLTDDSKLLSKDERALLAAVDEHVPSDEIVIGNPWTGASLVYALSDRKTLEPHMLGEPSETVRLIERRLNQLDSDPTVCDAVRTLKSYWVLDFGKLEVHGGSHPYTGISNLESRPSFRLVEKRGNARLYEIVGCR